MKQRLVGTVVIGCLAIIFIPALLDGEGVTAPEMTGSIPVSPPLPVVPDIEPVRPEISSDRITSSATTERPEPASVVPEPPSDATDTASTPTETNTSPPPPTRPTLTSAGLPETWTVRLGSFGEPANAQALVTRLREQGYKGFSRPLNSSRGLLTGVYVGPVLTESVAATLQQELAKAFELEGVVVQFTIDELEQ